MNFVSSRADRSVSAHHARECEHCDTAAPNPHSHRRMLIVFGALFGVVAALAVGEAAVQSVSDMGAAFPTAAAVLDGASWDRFFAAFGRVALIVLAVAGAVWIIRRRRKAPKK
jgi:hypothetical protein